MLSSLSEEIESFELHCGWNDRILCFTFHQQHREGWALQSHIQEQQINGGWRSVFRKSHKACGGTNPSNLSVNDIIANLWKLKDTFDESCRCISEHEAWCQWNIQGSTKTRILACPLGNWHFSSTCLKLFWTSPKFSQWSNKQGKFSTTLACQASDWWNLLVRQENLLALAIRRSVCRALYYGWANLIIVITVHVF